MTEFEIEAKNHGADIDLSECTLATYYGLKPDEHKVGVECRVDKDKGLIYLPLYLQMTTAEGVLKGIVELQFPEGNVRFSGVNFKVSFAPDDTKVESTDDFTVLENFIPKPTIDGVVGQVLSIDSDGNTIWRTLKEFDGDYVHLSNKPSINGVELNGDKSLEDLNIKQTYTADDIPFADGETFQQKFNNGELKGQDGVSGADGITPHIGDNGNWFIGETDTNKPSQGANGIDGTNGKDGIGITNAEINTSGELTLTYSNGTSANLGKVVGADGKDGADLSNEVEDIKAYIGYTDEDIAGLCVDYENKTFTRLAGAVGLSQGSDFNKFTMYGGRKRCNVSDDGTITAYYGDEGYTEDGSNGQVMVFQPKFYYKVVPLKLEKNADSNIGYHLRKVNYYVSSKPKTGFKLHPAFFDENGNAINYILFSADEGSMYDVSAKAYVNDGTNTDTVIEAGDLLCSVANVKPISGLKKPLNKVNLETMAQNRGAGWHLETIKAASANQLLMMIEVAMMSSQTGIGQGVVNIPNNLSYNCSSLTGSTAPIGNGTGQAKETVNEIGGTETAYTESGKVSVSYRGVENPWGNIWKHIQGINIWGDGTMLGGQPYIADGLSDFGESKHTGNYKAVGFTLPNASGYINAFGYGKTEYDWLLMPSETGGTNALPVGDYFHAIPNLNGYRITRLGGYWCNASQAGGFNWRCADNAGYRSGVTGGRLVYVPTAKV